MSVAVFLNLDVVFDVFITALPTVSVSGAVNELLTEKNKESLIY